MYLIRLLTVAIIVGCISLSVSAKKDTYKVEAISDSVAAHGEGPHWDVASQSLYYVNIGDGKLLRYDYASDKVFSCKIDGEDLASFVVPVEGTSDKFAVGSGRRVVIVTWNGVSETCTVDRELFSVQPEEQYNVNRFNDGKCDSKGRLFAGTMKYIGDEWSNRWGELYKYDKGKVELVKTDVGISNGLAWDKSDKKMYFIDTTDFEVKEYDYDLKRGVPSNPKVVFDLRQPDSADNLYPDGMTIDSKGNIYVATFNGQAIYKVDPKNGKILLKIEFPVKQITSAAFGGPKLDILYVTTSSNNGMPAPAGTLYKVTGLGVKGLRMSNIKL